MKKKWKIVIFIGYILLMFISIATTMVCLSEAITRNKIYYWIGIPSFIIFLILVNLPIDRWCGFE